jgi:hypothetical protein
MTYTLPRNVFDLLQETFNDKAKSELFARAIEESIQAIDDKAKESIIEKKEHLKIELKDELKRELVTKDIFEERFNTLNFKLNIFIGIALIALTLANPTFAELIKTIFGK